MDLFQSETGLILYKGCDKKSLQILSAKIDKRMRLKKADGAYLHLFHK